MIKERILILGKNGMLGSALFRLFSLDERFNTHGTVRRRSEVSGHNIYEFDTAKRAGLSEMMEALRPDIAINCIGFINKRTTGNPEEALEINGKFPHRLATICKELDTRLIHFSTDCVFSGKKGNYNEDDQPDADAWYGRTKLAGEITDPPALTLRTSLIGPEESNKSGLLEWFLSQKGEIDGYTRAIFSGFPTVEIFRIIVDYILPKRDVVGLYHVSSSPIPKYDLLQLVAERYLKSIKIKPMDDPKIDRSLDSTKFRKISGYLPPSWPELVDKMYRDQENYKIS